MPESPALPPHIEKLIDRLRLYGEDLSGTDLQALQGMLGFNEKLFLLCGGTLTLSFSIALGLGSHLSQQQHIVKLTLLIWAWRLLVISLFCCLYFHEYVVVLILNISRRMGYTGFTSTVTSLKTATAVEIDTTDFEKQIKKVDKTLKRMRNGLVVTGLLAKACTFIAFFLLLRFIEANAFVFNAH